MDKASNPDYIIEKAKRYCAFQERCVFDVKKKLYEWKVNPQKSEKIIHKLLQESFVNEARFARVFVGGKFRIKKWGKIKITAQLRARKISEENIRLSMHEINEEEYIKTLIQIMDKKRLSLKDHDNFTAKNKLVYYALSRGFEKDLIFKALNPKQSFKF
jgi:regulatory protein